MLDERKWPKKTYESEQRVKNGQECLQIKIKLIFTA